MQTSISIAKSMKKRAHTASRSHAVEVEMFAKRLTCACLGMLVASCGQSAPPASPTPSPGALSVIVSPSVLGVGELGQAIAPAGPGSVVWTSSNPTIAAITADGVIRALAAGVADVRGQTQNQSGVWPLRVLSGDEVTMTWAVGLGGGVTNDGKVVWTMSVGQTMSPTPRAVFDENQAHTVFSVYDVLPATREAWASSDFTIVSVTSSGQVTAIARGVADVTATWLGKVGSMRITVQ
jgi:hypothetical protein